METCAAARRTASLAAPSSQSRQSDGLKRLSVLDEAEKAVDRPLTLLTLLAPAKPRPKEPEALAVVPLTSAASLCAAT